MNGTVAEGLSQSCSERKKTAEKWMDLASDKYDSENQVMWVFDDNLGVIFHTSP